MFAREAYAVLEDDEEFKSLVANAEKFSVAEIEAKAKAIFADHVINVGAFNSHVEGAKAPKTIGVPYNQKVKTDNRYGNLFKKD